MTLPSRGDTHTGRGGAVTIAAVTDTTVAFHTRGGTRLHGVVTVPDDDAAGASPWPAVVLCQGLSGVCDVVLPDVAAVLADAGFASLRFDYAGFGNSDGDRGWIDPFARVVDAQHAFAWLAAQPYVDERRLGVYGHSYGGPVAVSLASRDRRVRAVVSVSGPGAGTALLRGLRTSWNWLTFQRAVDDDRATVASGGAGATVPTPELVPLSPEILERYRALLADAGHDGPAAASGPGGTTGTSTAVTGDGLGVSEFFLASADAMAAYHPEDDARRLGGVPLLLVSGDDDDVAAREDVAELFAAAPGPKHWHRVPGWGHLELDTPPGLQEAAELAADWFGEHLRCANG